ncbi:hypothetical protein ILYODFUR_026961 [Ilyodon furcidens]|uniref:Uncharacterized protein n=1 Tax=Ilyodon furcidens TaxID=33524 RepID=A0ABV0U9H0_9TELE
MFHPPSQASAPELHLVGTKATTKRQLNDLSSQVKTLDLSLPLAVQATAIYWCFQSSSLITLLTIKPVKLLLLSVLCMWVKTVLKMTES